MKDTQSTRRIVTADGVEVKIGSRVYNHYDGKWGVIVDIDTHPQPDTMKGQNSNTPIEEWDNYWFTHQDDNGGRTTLDGSRITYFDRNGDRDQWIGDDK